MLMRRAFANFMEISAKRGKQKRAMEILERITANVWSEFLGGFDNIYFEGVKIIVWTGMTRDELKMSINLSMLKASN